MVSFHFLRRLFCKTNAMGGELLSLVSTKSKAFAVRIIRLYQYLCSEKREFVISKQLLRSGTSIGANLAEADYAISRSDFLSKLYISLKETSETLYWLDLLYQTDYLTAEQYESIRHDAEELRKILSSSTKTTKSSISSK